VVPLKSRRRSEPFFTFVEFTAFFRSCFVPTLFAGKEATA
jgi:hypothetical protein